MHRHLVGGGGGKLKCKPDCKGPSNDPNLIWYTLGPFLGVIALIVLSIIINACIHACTGYYNERLRRVSRVRRATPFRSNNLTPNDDNNIRTQRPNINVTNDRSRCIIFRNNLRRKPNAAPVNTQQDTTTQRPANGLSLT